ncbi:MAG: hypothetical protein V4638_01155 [Bacteroidota bacterium]
MRLLTLLSILATASISYSQQPEDLIPKDAVSVFSLNNFQLLQKVSLDELVQYDFMMEIQQELFDGSTTGKSLKDSGIDFDKKLNIFYGKIKNYEISGITFAIKDQKQLFTVFDDFETEAPMYTGVDLYASLFNRLLVKNGNALLIRVDPTIEKIDQVTDSIWYARGYQNPWGDQDYYDIDQDEEGNIIDNWTDDQVENFDPSTLNTTEEENDLQKNYYELRDSVQLVYQERYFKDVCDDLFAKGNNLLKYDHRFASQMTHVSEGVFYLDNSRSLQKTQNLWYIETMFPSLYNDINTLYTGNVILGDLFLKDNTAEFHVEAQYGPELGSIYEEMNDSKFDKNTLKYIHKDNTAFFTYNVNLRQAYEKAFEVVVPMLSDEKNIQVAYNLLVLELLNEFVNKDALFSTYKGSMFGSFNGIKSIKTRKIEFVFDEQTYDYEEKEVEAEEEMPIFTLGFSTERNDIPAKVLKHLSKLTSRFKNMGEYWVYEEAILDAAPLYMIMKNGLFIMTNDEDLAKNHNDGYGAEAIKGKKAASIKKNGFMYMNVDWGNTIDKFPADFFSARQNEILNAMRGKTGNMELTSTKTTKEKTNFNLVYHFDNSNGNAGKHLLDLFNSVYVISR